MLARFSMRLCLAALVSIATSSFLHSQIQLNDSSINEPPTPKASVQPDAPDGDMPADADHPGGGEVLITGPLHEAFAEQFTNQPRPGLIVKKEPPQPIDEVPPEYRPEGYDIVWIPGYWGWDPEREDFLWVTGVWRQAPPDRNWIPGYWAQVTDGFQWISGFWQLTSVAEIEYLPKPPDPIEASPSSEAPSENHFWIPGQWSYANNNYQWRAGYWTEGYPDWVWVPDRYVWTPGGYIYRTGYWDYLLAERGTVFCPVYWSTPVNNYRFRPYYAINTGANLLANLFVNPYYNHYYFGNYYGSQYLGQSMYPWVTFTQQSNLYDPLFGYYRTQYRDAAYLQRITRLHNYYASNPAFQPPRTLALQQQRLGNNVTNINNINSNNSLALQAVRLSSLVNDQDSPLRLVRLQDQERNLIQQGINPARELRQIRARMERQGASTQDGNSVARNAAGQGAGANQPRRNGNTWQLPRNNEGGRLGSIGLRPGNVTPDVDGSDRLTGRDRARTDGNRDEARTDGDRDRARTDDNRERGRTDGNRDVARGDGNNRNANDPNSNQPKDPNTPSNNLPGNNLPGNNLPGNNLPGNVADAERKLRDRNNENARNQNGRPGRDAQREDGRENAQNNRPDPNNDNRPGATGRRNDAQPGNKPDNSLPDSLNLPGLPGARNPAGERANDRANERGETIGLVTALMIVQAIARTTVRLRLIRLLIATMPNLAKHQVAMPMIAIESQWHSARRAEPKCSA